MKEILQGGGTGDGTTSTPAEETEADVLERKRANPPTRPSPPPLPVLSVPDPGVRPTGVDEYRKALQQRPRGVLSDDPAAPSPLDFSRQPITDQEKQGLLGTLYGPRRAQGSMGDPGDRGRTLGGGDYITYTDLNGRPENVTYEEYQRRIASGEISIDQRQTARMVDKDFVAQRKAGVKWVDAQGRPLAKAPTLSGTTPSPPDLSEATTQAAADAGVPIGVSAADPSLKPGQYVVWGEEDDPLLPGVKRKVMMLADDAKMRVTELSPQDNAQIQILLNNPVTGVPDADITKAWDDAVKLASKFAATGQNVNVRDLFMANIRAKAEDAAKKNTGGYGVGAAPKAVISDSYAKAALSAGMLKTAGREPTDAEVQAFRAKLQADWDSGSQPDPTQEAIDWTRGNLASESTSTASVNYMDSIMSLMGARG